MAPEPMETAGHPDPKLLSSQLTLQTIHVEFFSITNRGIQRAPLRCLPGISWFFCPPAHTGMNQGASTLPRRHLSYLPKRWAWPALPWPCPSKRAQTMFHKGHWNVSPDPEAHIWLMNALHCESVCVFAAHGYPVKGRFVYVNWKDWSVTELLPSVKKGWRSQAFQGQPGVCGGGWDEVGRTARHRSGGGKGWLSRKLAQWCWRRLLGVP